MNLEKSYNPTDRTVVIRQSGLNISELQLLENTDQCLIDCKAVMRVKFYESLNTTGNQDFGWIFNGRDRLREYSFSYLNHALYNISSFRNECNPYETCGSDFVNSSRNCTYYANCTTMPYTYLKYRDDEIAFNFNDFVFESGKDYFVTLYGKKKQAMLGENNVEWVPKIYGIDLIEFDWWNNSWKNRRLVNLTMIRATSLENMTVNITLDTSANKGFQADCDDIRFISGDNTTQLSYMFENVTDANFGCGTTRTQLWVNISLIKPDNSSQIWLYWNNTGASAIADYRRAEGTATISHTLFGEVGGTNSYDTAMVHKWASGDGAGFTNVSMYGSAINCTAGNRWYETTTDVGWSIGGPQSNYTVMVWFNHAKGANAANIWQILMMRTPTYTVTPMRMEREVTANKLECSIGGVIISANNTFVDDGTWKFMACERNAGTMRMYLGNSSGFFLEKAASVGADATMATPSELIFCMGNNDTTTQPYTGAIDDMRIIDRKVTYDELYNIYRDGIAKLNAVETSSNCTGALTASLLNPQNNLEVQKDKEFALRINISCSGGCCGTVTASADPQPGNAIPYSSASYDTTIILLSFILGIAVTIFVVKIRAMP